MEIPAESQRSPFKSGWPHLASKPLRQILLLSILLIGAISLSGCVGVRSTAESYGTITSVEDHAGAVFAQTATIWVRHDGETFSESYNISNDGNKAHLLALARQYQSTGERVRVDYQLLWVFPCIDPDIACDQVTNISPAPMKT